MLEKNRGQEEEEEEKRDRTAGSHSTGNARSLFLPPGHRADITNKKIYIVYFLHWGHRGTGKL